MDVVAATAAREVLLRMLGAGVLESGHGDKRIKFATFEELKARIDYLSRLIDGISGAQPKTGTIRFR